MRCTSLLYVLVLAAACKQGSKAEPQQKPADPVRKLAGVYPEDFKCESITTLDALGQVLGGAVHQIDTPIQMPKGVPHPCNYQVQAQTSEFWTYDIDCRDNYKQTADKLFAQYKDDSAAMVTQYNQLADAGAIKPTDAGVPIHAPEPAAEVAVGAKGLDHHGQGLIFIDDDAPCYVRVVGPDGERRLELAKLVAKNLTFANAPMTPRPMP